MAEILLENVSKSFKGGVLAVDSVDLTIPDGCFMVFVGPSGCGKTTLLRMIAGVEDVTGGIIRIDGRIVNNVAPKDRDIAMVFQSYALYPHMSVYNNMAFGLQSRGVNKSEIKARVAQASRLLGLSGLMSRKPAELSGGQQQRVAMGRALVRQPKGFLMDEPLSNLDAKLRVQMRTEISRLQRDLAATMVYVTHDQTEAMTMGDLVAVLRNGVLQQVGPPQELYDRPANLFVAGFIGSPAMNMAEATLSSADGRCFVEFGGARLALPDRVRQARPDLDRYVGRKIALGIRPESMEDSSLGGEVEADTCISATVDVREAVGPEILLHFLINAPPVLTQDTKELAEDAGEETPTEADSEHAASAAPFVARVTSRSKAQERHSILLSVDTPSLHFFDLESGAAIYGTR
jgi:multiple sugar transport system ATP-binding protein